MPEEKKELPRWEVPRNTDGDLKVKVSGKLTFKVDPPYVIERID